MEFHLPHYQPKNMPQGKASHEETYKWISPIMHFGGKIEQKFDNRDQLNSVEPIRSALHEALTKEERAIFFSESLSAQCNLSGLSLFFEFTIAIYYYEVLEALHEIGSKDMLEALESCKAIIFGDADVPVNDFERLDDFVYADGSEERSERLRKIEDKVDERDGIKDSFERRKMEYVMECVTRGVLTKKYD